jgi:uncharacterized protein
MSQSRMFIPNLPVTDPQRTKAFWTQLGFELNPQFTSENSVCIQLNENCNIMFVAAKFFETLTRKPVPDLFNSCAVTLSFTTDSRAGVDELIGKVVAAGGIKAHEPEDQGFMYDCGFFDPDGHAWRVFWINPAATPTLSCKDHNRRFRFMRRRSLRVATGHRAVYRLRCEERETRPSVRRHGCASR